MNKYLRLVIKQQRETQQQHTNIHIYTNNTAQTTKNKQTNKSQIHAAHTKKQHTHTNT